MPLYIQVIANGKKKKKTKNEYNFGLLKSLTGTLKILSLNCFIEFRILKTCIFNKYFLKLLELNVIK